MFLHVFLSTTLFLVSAQRCDPIDFGKGSVVCRCNSTYCDYYPDPPPPNKGEFILYCTSKGGKRLERYNGKISKELGNGHKVTINAKKQYQKIEGFGGSFTDAASQNIKLLSSSAQDHLMRSYFASNGSKYNLGRVPIAGSDFSTRAYTYDDVDGDVTLKNFTLAREDIEFKIPVMKEALKLNPELRFLSASWTAPPWMKNRHTYYGWSYLQEKYYQTYADYIVKFLEEYQKNGLDIWAVSTGNEPFIAAIPVDIINAMFWSSGTASKWNLVLDPEGGPNWAKNYVDAPIIIDAAKGVFYKQPLYYVMTHFSKFIPRNSIMIEAQSNSGNILSIAFKTNDDQRIVVLYNKSNKMRNVSIIDEEVGNINIHLPENSLHTVLYTI